MHLSLEIIIWLLKRVKMLKNGVNGVLPLGFYK